ncbi:MAG TPA: hypothetical protein DEF48_12105 [Nostoc sp. UBA8866]|nr:hypothetical protein [Nostoc sp. UBA8866]
MKCSNIAGSCSLAAWTLGDLKIHPFVKLFCTFLKTMYLYLRIGDSGESRISSGVVAVMSNYGAMARIWTLDSEGIYTLPKGINHD